MLNRSAHFDNALPPDENFAWLDDASALDVEQARRMQHDGVGLARRRGLCCRTGSEEAGAKEQKRSQYFVSDRHMARDGITANRRMPDGCFSFSDRNHSRLCKSSHSKGRQI